MAKDDDWTGAAGEDVDQGSREAALWFATLNGENASTADRAAFRAWLRRDPENAEKYAAIERLWAGVGELPEIRDRRRANTLAVTRRAVGKAAIAVAVGGGAWWAASEHPLADYRTGKGERRSVTLADGSTIELATRTALSTQFGSGERRVTLHFGEAYFSVAPDPQRPFTVEAGPGVAKALGTRFSVTHLGGDDVHVAVEEGRVELRRGDDRVVLSGGSGADIDARGLGAVAAIDPATEFAWRDGRLVFISARLGRVVEELNRWRAGRIILTDARLAARTVTLIVDLNRSGDALTTLAGALPIRQISLTPYLTVILPA